MLDWLDVARRAAGRGCGSEDFLQEAVIRLLRYERAGRPVNHTLVWRVVGGERWRFYRSEGRQARLVALAAEEVTLPLVGDDPHRCCARSELICRLTPPARGALGALLAGGRVRPGDQGLLALREEVELCL